MRQSTAKDDQIKDMLNSTNTCLCCGTRLSYLDKEKRRNRGYCSLRCFYQYPPKLAYACREWKKTPQQLLCDMLTKYTVSATCELLGIHKQALYSWIKKYHIRKVEKWVSTQKESPLVKES